MLIKNCVALVKTSMQMTVTFENLSSCWCPVFSSTSLWLATAWQQIFCSFAWLNGWKSGLVVVGWMTSSQRGLWKLLNLDLPLLRRLGPLLWHSSRQLPSSLRWKRRRDMCFSFSSKLVKNKTFLIFTHKKTWYPSCLSCLRFPCFFPFCLVTRLVRTLVECAVFLCFASEQPGVYFPLLFSQGSSISAGNFESLTIWFYSPLHG